jgi:hypothetical protein
MKDEIHVLNYINSLSNFEKGRLIFILLKNIKDMEIVNWDYDEKENLKFHIYWEASGEDLV